MVGWHHHESHGHESEQTPGVGDGQGGLACCSPWGLGSSFGSKGGRKRKMNERPESPTAWTAQAIPWF